VAIVKTVIELGRNMGLRVVAEGVETVEQLEVLRALDCDEAQGFFFAYPEPAEVLTAHLASGRLRLNPG
jgi:EAL domain-containing protein (putative c-di-GMP-specific phosphodiesterase class I)